MYRPTVLPGASARWDRRRQRPEGEWRSSQHYRGRLTPVRRFDALPFPAGALARLSDPDGLTQPEGERFVGDALIKVNERLLRYRRCQERIPSALLRIREADGLEVYRHILEVGPCRLDGVSDHAVTGIPALRLSDDLLRHCDLDVRV